MVCPQSGTEVGPRRVKSTVKMVEFAQGCDGFSVLDFFLQSGKVVANNTEQGVFRKKMLVERESLPEIRVVFDLKHPLPLLREEER